MFAFCFWLSFQEGTDDGTAIMIVGNKVDLVEEDSQRAVQSKTGKKLAEVHCYLHSFCLAYRIITAFKLRSYRGLNFQQRAD